MISSSSSMFVTPVISMLLFCFYCKLAPEVNKLSLNGLTGLLSLSQLVIANDTGPLHLADALGCKTVGLYWCANMINAAPPFRKNSVCLSSWMITCPLCHMNCASGYPFDTPFAECDHETSFVAKISVKEVIVAAEKCLQG